MPSAANGWKFKYDSPISGRSAEELDELLTPPGRAPPEPWNRYIKVSYERFGEIPSQAVVRKMRDEMER
jgi:hypothetical protein